MNSRTGDFSIQSVAVIGLGYVGLPLAVALADHADVIGYDISADRVTDLAQGRDRTGEVSPERLAASNLALTSDPAQLRGCDAYLITVPTPIDESKRPDLSAVATACRTVGAVLAKGAIVVLESTVYPGTVDEFCAPILEQTSGLACGADFFLGYSPERINPGDAQHQLGRITKVVSGQTPEISAALAAFYGRIGPVYEAPDIRTAEAAKVIENAQRDLNIAFINELAMIFNRLDLDTTAVLETAATKWNFLPFRPGLVGGHCIGVDPYYLTYRAEQSGYHPEIILAGRRINDNMGRFIGTEVARHILKNDLPKRAAVLGATFKENVPDIRNSGSFVLIGEIETFGIAVDVHDPLADAKEVLDTYGRRLTEPADNAYGALVLAVAHKQYADWATDMIEGKLVDGGIIADIKGLWRDRVFADHLRRWRL